MLEDIPVCNCQFRLNDCPVKLPAGGSSYSGGIVYPERYYAIDLDDCVYYVDLMGMIPKGYLLDLMTIEEMLTHSSENIRRRGQIFRARQEGGE